MATIFNQPNHGRTEGDVECWASTDKGQTWKYRGTPAKHEPGTNRMNVAAGLAYNGDLIVISSGWSNVAPVGEAFKGRGQVSDSWVCRSSDGGRTWQVNKSAISKPKDAETIVPFGNIVKISEKKLAAPFYSGSSSYILFSFDDGRTWREENAIIVQDCGGEPFILPLTNQRCIAVVRSCRNNKVDDVVALGEYLRYFVSDDCGINWKEEYHLTGSAQHPGHLLRLANGCILLTYGNRRSPSPGIQILLSEDEGRSWNFHARDLISLQGTVIQRYGYCDCGYPSTVQLADSTLVTAYYSWGIESHSRYHMGVVRWKLE
jgi:hypothetical protein